MPQEVTHLWRLIQDWLDRLDFPPTQSKLAERVGVTRSAVSDWKYGRSTPTPQNMRALAELMQPQLGPATYGLLIRAMNVDGGYIPASEVEGGGGRGRPAANKTAGEDRVTNLGSRRRGESKLSSIKDPYEVAGAAADDPDNEGKGGRTNEGDY